MSTNKIVITITVEVPDGTSVAVQSAPSGQVGSPGLEGSVFDDANVRVRPFLLAFETAMRAEGFRIERPDGSRQDYRNVLPPAGYGASRIGHVNITSGRFALHGVPDLAEQEPLAEVFKNNDEPSGTRIYLRSDEAVTAAVRLSLLALEVR